MRDVSPENLRYAEQLRQALAASWSRLADASTPRAEAEGLGCEDYRRTFGHPITPRHWRRLVILVRERGGGRPDQDPLAVYLPKRIRRAAAAAGPEPCTPPAAADPEMADLAAALVAISDIVKPTATEKGWLWEKVFEHFEFGIAEGKTERAWKTRILEWINVNAPCLGGTPASLRHLWGTKLIAWRKSDRKIAALQPNPNAPQRAPIISEKDKKTVEAVATFETGKNVSMAWRLARQRGQLSANTDRLTWNPSRKEYVPPSIRRSVGPALRHLADYHRGPRTGKLNGAYITRDWSGVNAGDWYQADDVTFPVYYYVPEGDWFRLTRGQCLLMIDLRSRKGLDFVLIDEKSYDALRIRRLMNRICDRFGLPRKGFYFEGGIWERSKIVTGGKAAALPGPAEIESGFRSLGLRFMHARTPRAKPVERVLGIAQDLMEGVPGYAGRNEMTDRFERIHRAKLDVEARRKHPKEAGFLSAEEWFLTLSKIIETYNATPMESGATGGLSPDDAWRKHQASGDPPSRLPPEARHLLATHRSMVTVGRNGVTLSVGKRKFIYRSEATGERIGRQVIAWFDPEAPEFCTLTDLDSRDPVLVPLAPAIPAMDATREEMEAAFASVNSHERPIRERYSRLRASYLPPTRANIVAPSVAALGREMATQRAEATAEAVQVEKRKRKIRKQLAEALPDRGGAALAADAATDPARAEALNRVARFAAS